MGTPPHSDPGGINPDGRGPAQPAPLADPHPSAEENPHREHCPGGANPLRDDGDARLPGGSEERRR